jgi:hypothetical protein
MKLADPLQRTQSMLAWIEELKVEEMPGAADYFRRTGEAHKNSPEFQLFLTAWARVDPLGALAQLSTEKDFASNGRHVLSTWARQDPVAAIRWAEENFEASGNPNKANSWIEGIVEGVALSNPEMANSLISSMPESKAKREAIEAMLRELSKARLDAPKEWISSLPAGAMRDEAVEQFAQQLARYNPQDALTWAQSLGGESLQNAAKPIIENWAGENLEEATSWAGKQSPEVLASTAPTLIKEMLKNGEWTQASEWLAPHDGDPRFDEAIEQFVRQANREYPALAADWARRLTDPIKREQGLQNLFKKWQGFDPAGMQEYLNNHDVPESVRNHFSPGSNRGTDATQ